MALQKLRKLRETIRQLPATGQRQELVEAVKEHPVVLVAGAREKICEDLKDVDGLVMFIGLVPKKNPNNLLLIALNHFF